MSSLEAQQFPWYYYIPKFQPQCPFLATMLDIYSIVLAYRVEFTSYRIKEACVCIGYYVNLLNRVED